ncbi:MAG: uroporphyrinogen decarboxylase family protein [Bacteroidota bacterium]
MTGKELIFKAFENKELERTPWIPYTGIQVGSLSEITADKLLQSSELLLENLLKAHELYGPDGMPVVFDLQIEAEILGCELMWDEKAPPSVKSHPLSESKEINLKLPEKNDGRLPIVLDVMEKLKKDVGETTALYGLACGPLTLASHLRGMDLFMDMYEDPEFVQNLIDFSTDVFIRVADYYIEAGMDIIAAVDPIVSQISPDSFVEFLHKPYAKIFEYLKEKNVYNGLFVCGDATKNLEVMCKTKPDSISIDENIDIVEAKKITDSYNVVISGNIPLTTVMLLGNQQDNQQFTIDLIEKLGAKNFILAPGCDMPYDVPQENIIGIAQAVQDPHATRILLKNYKKEEINIEVAMPDYNNLEKPLIEVYTVDSATCAACGYMAKAAFQMKDVFRDKIDVVEHKITEVENVVRVGNLGLRNLPTLLINGEPKFVSIIPNKVELKTEIEKYL